MPAPPAKVPEPPEVGTLPPCRPAALTVRWDYHPECEAAALNKHVNPELSAFCVYLSVAFCFDHQVVPLKHFAALFLWQWREEWEQAQVLTRLRNQQRERIRLGEIPRPEGCRWKSGRRAMRSALHVDRMVNQGLLSLFPLATIENDAHLHDFLEHHHLRQGAKFIRNLAAGIIN